MIDRDVELFSEEVAGIVKNNSFDGCNTESAQQEARCLYRGTAINVLKSVFRYGYGSDTHCNIMTLLDELGVRREEYIKWNQAEANE